MIEPLSVGTLKLVNNMALAPMAGITNAVFRLLAGEGGAGLCVTEMISAESIKYNNRKSFKMLELMPGEKAVAVQIFGSDPGSMALAAAAAEKAGAAAVDINAGCPVKKILRSGAGAELMKKPCLLADIVYRVRRNVKVPVTVKFRVGLVRGNILSPELARVCEEAGASALTLHGRYACDFHSGEPDLEAVFKTASAVKIPVFGNGGIDSPAMAEKYFAAGCRGISVGRAAIYNPYIFSEIKAFINDGVNISVQDSDRLKLFWRFLKLNSGLYGEQQGLVRARKLIGYWLKNIPEASSMRQAFMRVSTLSQAEELLIRYIPGIDLDNGD